MGGGGVRAAGRIGGWQSESALSISRAITPERLAWLSRIGHVALSHVEQTEHLANGDRLSPGSIQSATMWEGGRSQRCKIEYAVGWVHGGKQSGHEWRDIFVECEGEGKK